MTRDRILDEFVFFLDKKYFLFQVCIDSTNRKHRHFEWCQKVRMDFKQDKRSLVNNKDRVSGGFFLRSVVFIV